MVTRLASFGSMATSNERTTTIAVLALCPTEDEDDKKKSYSIIWKISWSLFCNTHARTHARTHAIKKICSFHFQSPTPPPRRLKELNTNVLLECNIIGTSALTDLSSDVEHLYVTKTVTESFISVFTSMIWIDVLNSYLIKRRGEVSVLTWNAIRNGDAHVWNKDYSFSSQKVFEYLDKLRGG